MSNFPPIHPEQHQPFHVQGQDPFLTDKEQADLYKKQMEETVLVQGQEQSEVRLPEIAVADDMDETDFGSLDSSTFDPDFDYRWVHNSPAKIQRRLRRRWTFVRKSEDKVRKVFEGREEKADDFLYNGDTVLMKIRKDIHAHQTNRVNEVARARLAAPKGQFRKKAKDAGVVPAGRKYRGEPT